MSSFDPPPCPNTLSGQSRCARSDVYVERETDDVFVIRCRTCRGLNLWPKDRSENRARYEAALRQNMMREQQQEALRRKKAYSY